MHMRCPRVLTESKGMRKFPGTTLFEERRAGEVETVKLTRWTSIEAIRAFQGEEIEQANVHPEAAAMPRDFDRRVRP